MELCGAKMSHLMMREVPNPGKKTKRWIITNDSGAELGSIFFHAPWRNYVWEMLPGSIFDVTCTQEVVTFLAEHKNDRQEGA
jgi:hypothetical protein